MRAYLLDVDVSEADDVKRHGRHQLKLGRAGQHQIAQQGGEAARGGDGLAQGVGAERAERKPHLQGAEPAAEVGAWG